MITTPLDSAVLDSKEQYVFYHKMVDFVLKELIVSVQQEKLCTQQELLIFKTILRFTFIFYRSYAYKVYVRRRRQYESRFNRFWFP